MQSIVEQARAHTLGAVLAAYADRKARRDAAAFSIALIALSAKMAKADGVVTDNEIDAFKRFFALPEEETGKVRMLYALAQQDVAGFDAYLRRVARLFADEPEVLEDVLDCLFHVASADGAEHPRERAMLEDAARIFGLPETTFRRLRAIHYGVDAEDPFAVLGLSPGAPAEEVKSAYRTLVKNHHPDALIARGLPQSLVRIAEQRMAAINAAYEAALSS